MGATWTEYPKPISWNIADKIVQIKDSTWYHTSKFESVMMVKYCLNTSKITQTVKYPDNVNPYCHSICAVQDIIYIIDGHKVHPFGSGYQGRGH